MKLTVMMMVVAAMFAAVAQEPAKPAHRPGPGTGPAPMTVEPVVRMALNPKMAEKLGVTEEQTAKLKALADNREALKGLHEKARRGFERQAELLKAEKLDEAAVMAALDETWNARKEIARLQTKRIVDVRSILTAEQIAKAREAMKAQRGKPREKSPKKAGNKALKPVEG